MSKILITGGSGMVGKSLKKYLPDAMYLSSKDCDLTNENDDFIIDRELCDLFGKNATFNVNGFLKKIK